MRRYSRARLAALSSIVLLLTAPAAPGANGEGLSVRITSPLGRTGGVGTVRIVAQIQRPSDATLAPVRFYVDGALFKTDDDGPPYAVEWTDENPFERRELAVEVEDSDGRKGHDRIVLEAFEITEIAEVASVLLEAGVYDRKGRFVSGLNSASFTVKEDGVAQAIDLVNHERVSATFALLIDSSQSMSRRFDFVKDAASRLTAFLRPKDSVIVAPFAKRLGPLTGPTGDRKTIIEAIQHVEPTGGTAILDALIELSERLPLAEDRRSVILISDGYDEHSHASFEEALAAVKGAGITIYVVGIGGVAGISLKGERELKRLANETGGRVFFPPRGEELASVYDQLAADAQNRYLVTYTPTNTARDGAWRAVDLTTSSDQYPVRTRAGYRAPKPPPIRPTLEFTVTDLTGQYVEISADDLVVSEDGVDQKVDTFHEAEAPVSIVLALDASGSMRKSADALIAAARTFVEALRPEDKLSLVFFSDGVVATHDLSTSRQISVDAISTYKPVGGTALYDAMASALTTLKSVEGRRAVVLMSDGRDENNPGTAPGSQHTLAQVLELATEVDATILPIGLGSNLDRQGLERLAEISGGAAYFPSDASQLHAQFTRTVENLRRRYASGTPQRTLPVTAHGALWRSNRGLLTTSSAAAAGTSRRIGSQRLSVSRVNEGLILDKPMSEDSPKIVNLEASLELSEFFSETDFPSETNLPLNGAPQIAPVDETVARVQKLMSTDERVEDAPSTDKVREKLPRLSLHRDQPAQTSSPLGDQPAPDDTPLTEAVRSGATLEHDPVRASAHPGPATITEFPVRPQTPPAVALPSLPLGPVSLVELIERHNGFDWREAVAVIRQICLYLRDHSPQAPILLDPRTIQITDNGEVRLLSGQTSSDPLVIQVGRLLRTMLMGKEAPPELRLLLSQATFELPIFESIEDVDRALAQLDKLDEPGPAGMALLRAVAAPAPQPSPEDQRGNPPPVRPIFPMKRAAGRRTHSRSRFGTFLGGYASHVAAIFAAIALIGLLLVTRPAMLFPDEALITVINPVAPNEIATSGNGAAGPDRTAPTPNGSKELRRETPGRAAPQSASRHPTARVPERNRTGVVVATPIESSPATGEPPRAGSTGARPTDTLVIAPTPQPSSLRDSERQAASLLEQGRTAAAAMAFDALVMRNPLYEPRTSDLTPEALSAFRNSQRLQLPGIAQRNYEQGKAALAAGDADRALSQAKEAMGILDKRVGEFRPQLREDVRDLLEQARIAVTAVNEIVYSETDPGVIPPRPLSAQLPLTNPIGIPPNRVGWLDMVINRDGTVFSVKLHTPLNRHHERMIVSPAKAWLYRPATRNGRPIMCRILVKVNLPESGTE